MKYQKLSELCHMKAGTTPSRSEPAYWGGHIPWAKISDIENADQKLWDTSEHITEQGLQVVGNHLIQPGTLLFAIYGSIGKTTVAARPMATNQGILSISVRDKSILLEQYLRFWLRSQQSRFLNDARGVTQKNLSVKYFRNLTIPLPSLRGQQQITALLEQASGLVHRYRKALKDANQIRQSLFVEFFGEPANNSANFPMGVIGDLLESTTYGSSKKSGATGAWPMLRMGNLTYDGRINFTDMKYVDLSEFEAHKYQLRPGDILFNRTNSEDLVGKTAVFRSSGQYTFAGYLIRCRVNHLALPEYLSAYLNSKYGKAVLAHTCKRIIGMANINANELKAIPIPLPPVSLQTKFRELLEQTDNTRLKYEAALGHAQQLFDTLLYQNFIQNGS